MQKEALIAVTGAAGFIGSALVGWLNQAGYHYILLVDDFSKPFKKANFQNKQFVDKIDRAEFHQWTKRHPHKISYFFHLGARTDTTETNEEIFLDLNLNYSKAIWKLCVEEQIPLVYASSAATYGDGTLGYKDSEDLVEKLKPLNAYGISKNEFDKWAIQQKHKPPFWAGLKFFNVYGPNEYHKGRMASVIFHAFNQIKETGKVKLFRSHNPDYEDGGQLRDFIYVKDVLKVTLWLMHNRPKSGLYNLGTGQARTFYDLAKAVFSAFQKPVNVDFINTPIDIRDKYQYFTEAKMDKLRNTGYMEVFFTLEDGVSDYLKQYLIAHRYL